MNLSASDLIHLVLGVAVIGSVTALGAIHVVAGDAVIPTDLAVAGISGVAQVAARTSGSANDIRALLLQIAQAVAPPIVPAAAPAAAASPVGPGVPA